MKNFAKRVSALVLALVVGAAALCPAALAAASLPDLPKDECVVDDADRKSTRLNSSHPNPSRMPSSA